MSTQRLLSLLGVVLSLASPLVHAASVGATPIDTGGATVTAPPSPGAIVSPPIFARGGVPRARVPGRALIKLKGVSGQRLVLSRASDIRAQTALRDLGARQGLVLAVVRPSIVGYALVEVRSAAQPTRIPNEAETLAMIEKLRTDSAIDAASDERWLRGLANTNDPFVAKQWNLDAIGITDAWKITQGTTSQRIGIVDTGIVRAHEDVGARALAGFDFITEGGNDGDGRDADFADAGDACAADHTPDSFHGTHVAGIAAATVGNGLGIAGIHPNAGLVVIRALGTCGGTLDDIMEGAAWAAGEAVSGVPAVGADKVSVLNLSLGVDDTACSQFETDVIARINALGTVFVVAAGNNGGSTGSPGNCPGTITVAAHGPTNALAGYSSFDSAVDVVAPGGDSTFGEANEILSSIGPTTSGYELLEGTSMAAPHVTAAVALLQSLDPSLTRDQLVSILTTSGGTCTGCGTKPRLRLDAALKALQAGGAPVIPVVVPPAVGLTDDALEENDTLTDAAPLACNTSTTLTALANDLDFFSVAAGEASDVAISLHAQTGQDLDLYVLSASNIFARSESLAGDEALRGRTSGTFRLAVVPFSEPKSGAAAQDKYDLTIACRASTAPVTDEFVEDETVDLSTDVITAPAPVDAGTGETAKASGCASTRPDTATLAAALLALLAVAARRRPLARQARAHHPARGPARAR